MSVASAPGIHEQLQWRYAVKKFADDKKITPDLWSVLEQSLVLAPSSYGLQPWKFYVVMNPELKAKLPEISWGQTQPRDCSHMVVFAIKTNFGAADIDRLLKRITEVRGTPAEALEGYRKMMMGSLVPPKGFDIEAWAANQVYIALGQFMTTAAALGVDTCPMEGIVGAKYDELLGITAEGYKAVVGCAAGYRASDDKYAEAAKVRYKTEEVVSYK